MRLAVRSHVCVQLFSVCKLCQLLLRCFLHAILRFLSISPHLSSTINHDHPTFTSFIVGLNSFVPHPFFFSCKIMVTSYTCLPLAIQWRHEEFHVAKLCCQDVLQRLATQFEGAADLAALAWPCQEEQV